MITGLNRKVLKQYHSDHMAANRMALIGAGVDHEEFVALGEKYFSDMPAVYIYIEENNTRTRSCAHSHEYYVFIFFSLFNLLNLMIYVFIIYLFLFF
jgi:predicted Zn-dependent peptidase